MYTHSHCDKHGLSYPKELHKICPRCKEDWRRNTGIALRSLVCVVLLVTLLVSILFDFSYDTKTGYAGEPIDFKPGVVYTNLHFNPAGIESEGLVFVAGTHITQNDGEWSSLGYQPQKGDFVRVHEFRIFVDNFDYDLVHGWGYTEKLPTPEGQQLHAGIDYVAPLSLYAESWEDDVNEGNPYSLGQKVFPAEDFGLTRPSPEELDAIAGGVEVIDINNELVRVKYSDGGEHVFSYKWWLPAHEEKQTVVRYLRTDWKVGNTFEAFTVVCAIPDSVRDVPDYGIIWSVDGELLYVLGSRTPINHGHYQECK